MARAVTNITIADPGRDQGKVFVITEMPASKGERWAFRVLLALIKGGVNLPDGFERLGMAGLVELGLKALGSVDPDVAEPLLDEMMACVQIMPDPSRPHVVRDLIESDIEEITTRLKLRAEWWKLHLDFLKAAAPSIFAQAQAATPGASSGRNTKTSRRQSGR